MVESQNVARLAVLATGDFSVNSDDYSKHDAWATISIPVLYFGKNYISNVFVFRPRDVDWGLRQVVFM